MAGCAGTAFWREADKHRDRNWEHNLYCLDVTLFIVPELNTFFGKEYSRQRRRMKLPDKRTSSDFQFFYHWIMGRGKSNRVSVQREKGKPWSSGNWDNSNFHPLDGKDYGGGINSKGINPTLHCYYELLNLRLCTHRTCSQHSRRHNRCPPPGNGWSLRCPVGWHCSGRWVWSARLCHHPCRCRTSSHPDNCSHTPVGGMENTWWVSFTCVLIYLSEYLCSTYNGMDAISSDNLSCIRY